MGKSGSAPGPPFLLFLHTQYAINFIDGLCDALYSTHQQGGICRGGRGGLSPQWFSVSPPLVWDFAS